MSVSPEDWNHIESLFAQAIQLPPDERLTFLNQQCETESIPNRLVVLEEVESLLANHFESSTEQMTTENGSVVRESLIDLVKRLGRQSLDEDDRDAILKDLQSRRHEDIVATIEASNSDLQMHGMLGRGGTGVVFRAHQISLGRDVAIKVHSNLHADDVARARFVAESRSTAKVNHHNIVDIFSVHDVAGLTFQVMELIPGPTLKLTIEKLGHLKPKTAARIARQIAEGLSAAHQQELIHRDVKPANIMFLESEPELDDSDPPVKLLDFGIARDLATGQMTLDSMIIGTPAYMSPEQLLNPRDIDHRSDVYGLGVTLYEMLTGTRPFAGAPHMIVNQLESQSPTEPRSHDDRIPKDLESICLKAIHRLPARRYESAKDCAEDLQRFLDGKPTVARPASQLERLTSWCRRNRRLAASIGVMLLLGLMLLAGSFAFAWVVSSKNKQIVQQQSETLKSSVQGIVDSDAGALLSKIELLDSSEPTVLDQLTQAMQSKDNAVIRRANAAVALSLNGQPQTEYLIDMIDQLAISPSVCRNLEAAFSTDPQAIPSIQRSIDPRSTLTQQAQRIILLAQLGEWEPWEMAAADRRDPSLRTEVIHLLDRWHGDLIKLSESAAPCLKLSWGWTICQALSEIDSRTISQPARESLISMLSTAQQPPDYATFHFRQLAIQNLMEASPSLAWNHPDCLSFPEDIHMIRIESATTMLGRFDPATNEVDYPPHSVTLTHDYYVSDTEVSVAQFREFALQHLEDRTDNVFVEQFKGDSSEDAPVRYVSWFEAVEFCNWLSRKHGLDPVYEKQPEEFVWKRNDGSETRHPQWTANWEASGFRLPTEAEWGFALRNDSRTPFHFGHNDRLVDLYSVSSSRRKIAPKSVRHLRPNSRGIYGMFGNVWEWSYDRFQRMNEKSLVDPRGPESYPEGTFAHVYLGAGVATSGGNLDCEARGFDAPDVRYDNLGFRLAMNAPQPPTASKD